MDKFENKYGIKEDQTVKDFHKSRRMFCIYNNILYIAEPNVPYSHAVWFEKKGWMNKDHDNLMDIIVRGIVAADGDVYFMLVMILR